MNFKDKKAAVMKVLSKYDLDSTAVWDCHGTPVILHKALERIADIDSITFEPPQIVETNAMDKVAVICVTGRKGDLSAWSFGEAMPSNNKNAYPFAMAEKRAKDRVILKLVGLSGDAYSEDEADDFKESRPINNRMSKSAARVPYDELQTAIDNCDTLEELRTIWGERQDVILTLPLDWVTGITDRKDARKHEILNNQAAA